MLKEMEQIRLCKIEEIKILQSFINKFWVNNHILSHDESLLKFQHFNDGENFNYVVSYDTKTRSFNAVLGFIPTCNYDKEIKQIDIWLAIWKKNDSILKTKGIGLKLYEYLVEKYNPNSIAAIGINDNIKLLYQKLGFKTGELNHYYIFNLGDTKIASIENLKSNFYISKINNVTTIKNFNLLNSTPKKSLKYLINRYANHPTYKYIFWGVYGQKDDELIDIVVLRENKIKGSSCLRIVEVFNNFYALQNSKLSNEFLRYIHINYNKVEYIDCLNYGLDEKVFYNLGFKKVSDDIIIPNYFEPFEQKNITIEFAYRVFNASPPDRNYIIWKGDSDQDRPNILK